ncbi:MAG: hypothetical protein AVDCRST_MAG57-1334, partial [uncultured Blastococcus sp.]
GRRRRTPGDAAAGQAQPGDSRAGERRRLRHGPVRPAQHPRPAGCGHPTGAARRGVLQRPARPAHRPALVPGVVAVRRPCRRRRRAARAHRRRRLPAARPGRAGDRPVRAHPRRVRRCADAAGGALAPSRQLVPACSPDEGGCGARRLGPALPAARGPARPRRGVGGAGRPALDDHRTSGADLARLAVGSPGAADRRLRQERRRPRGRGRRPDL